MGPHSTWGRPEGWPHLTSQDTVPRPPARAALEKHEVTPEPLASDSLPEGLPLWLRGDAGPWVSSKLREPEPPAGIRSTHLSSQESQRPALRVAALCPGHGSFGVGPEDGHSTHALRSLGTLALATRGPRWETQTQPWSLFSVDISLLLPLRPPHSAWIDWCFE